MAKGMGLEEGDQSDVDFGEESRVKAKINVLDFWDKREERERKKG